MVDNSSREAAAKGNAVTVVSRLFHGTLRSEKWFAGLLAFLLFLKPNLFSKFMKSDGKIALWVSGFGDIEL